MQQRDKTGQRHVPDTYSTAIIEEREQEVLSTPFGHQATWRLTMYLNGAMRSDNVTGLVTVVSLYEPQINKNYTTCQKRLCNLATCSWAGICLCMFLFNDVTILVICTQRYSAAQRADTTHRQTETQERTFNVTTACEKMRLRSCSFILGGEAPVPMGTPSPAIPFLH